jgi:hypothetical protein
MLLSALSTFAGAAAPAAGAGGGAAAEPHVQAGLQAHCTVERMCLVTLWLPVRPVMQVLQHQQLVLEVVQQLSRMFKPDFKLTKPFSFGFFTD